MWYILKKKVAQHNVDAMSCSIVQCCVAQCSVVQHNVVLCSMVQCCVVQCCVVQCSVVQLFMALYRQHKSAAPRTRRRRRKLVYSSIITKHITGVFMDSKFHVILPHYQKKNKQENRLMYSRSGNRRAFLIQTTAVKIRCYRQTSSGTVLIQVSGSYTRSCKSGSSFSKISGGITRRKQKHCHIKADQS